MNNYNDILLSKEELMIKLRTFYNTEVRPILFEYEKQRKFVYKYHILIAVSLLLMLMSCCYCLSFFIVMLVVVYFILFLGGYIINFLSRDCDKVANPTIDLLKEEVYYKLVLKRKLMPKFIAIFENLRWIQGEHINSVKVKKIFEKLKIFPHYFLMNFDDMLKGSFGNIKFELFEVKTGYYCDLRPVLFFLFISLCLLVSICYVYISFIKGFLLTEVLSLIILSGLCFSFIVILPLIYLIYQAIVSQSTRGVLIRCILPIDFKSHTFIYENAPSSNKLFFKNKKNYEEVLLEDVDFNRKYHVFTQDQVEARYFLTLSFMERFKNLKTAFRPEYQRIEVIGNEMFIYLKNNKDCFEMSSMREETTYSKFVNLFEEIYSVLDLLEQLKINKKLGL